MVNPPLGMLAANIYRANMYVFGSMKASMICSRFILFVLYPALFDRSRASAISRSSSVRKEALVGESGSRKSIRIPQRKVTRPKIINSHYPMSAMSKMHRLNGISTFHGVREPSIFQIPTAIRFPKISEIEFPQNQTPWRRGCSEARYQRDVIRLNPGEMLASVQPRKKRTIIIPVKFVVAAWQARITDQMMLYNIS